MTLQTWWGEHPGWVPVSSGDHELVVARPTITGGRCSQVYVRAAVDVDAWPGMALWNQAVILAANDLSTGDDETGWSGNVNSPHTNLYVDKSWNWGQLVPGGELRYNIHVGNYGNVPVGAFRITDTLPVNVSFLAAWTYDQTGQHAFDPVLNANGVVVWEIPGLDNGYWRNIEVVLRVAQDAQPGTLLVNTAEVTRLPGEDSYDDNAASWTETLFGHGPNLRVRKDGWWDDWGKNTRRAAYNLNVENVGDETSDWVTVTDIYPAGMRLDGGVSGGFWRWWEWQDNGDHFTMTLELLEPGWSVGFNFGLITDTEPLPFGLIFTNTAEVTLDPNDPNPDDNVATVLLTTGPNLYVVKELVDGEILPGELVTFSLRFGNDHQSHEWWWNTQGNVWLTDTLPGGFEFITATRRSWSWAPYAPDYDDGMHIAWDTGNMPAGGEDEILVTARIPITATGLDTFTNHVEVASSEPLSDSEPIYTNNHAILDLVLTCPLDMNGDGQVTVLDIQDVASRWQAEAAGGPPYDVRYDVAPPGAPDGVINIADIQRIAAAFMSCP